jgi:hypothetical protein
MCLRAWLISFVAYACGSCAVPQATVATSAALDRRRTLHEAMRLGRVAPPHSQEATRPDPR